MSETPETVSEWAEATFGPAGTNFSVACRANREMACNRQRKFVLDGNGHGQHEEKPLPSVAEMRGSDPDFTGGQGSVEYLRGLEEGDGNG